MLVDLTVRNLALIEEADVLLERAKQLQQQQMLDAAAANAARGQGGGGGGGQ